MEDEDEKTMKKEDNNSSVKVEVKLEKEEDVPGFEQNNYSVATCFNKFSFKFGRHYLFNRFFREKHEEQMIYVNLVRLWCLKDD